MTSTIKKKVCLNLFILQFVFEIFDKSFSANYSNHRYLIRDGVDIVLFIVLVGLRDVAVRFFPSRNPLGYSSK